MISNTLTLKAGAWGAYQMDMGSGADGAAAYLLALQIRVTDVTENIVAKCGRWAAVSIKR
jgi:hypothetical protein